MEHEESAQASESDTAAQRGVFDGFSGYVTPTEDDWRSVLRDGLVVIDTNVLLNLYRYNQAARETFMQTLQSLGSCLWVPHQVMEEFWRNRESAIEDPQKQLDASEAALKKGLQKAVEDLRSWTNRVSLERSNVEKLESTLSGAFDQVIAAMAEVVNGGEGEMSHDTSQDKVVAALDVLLKGKVGPPLDQEDLVEQIAEGKRRIQAQVPPGYKDKAKSARGDNSEVGDYLVWLQLIREAKARGVDVLLVTGDTKEDWWRTRNNIPVGPRNELAEELKREAGARLYMLKPDKLLSYARDFLQVEVTEDSVQNVEMVAAQSTSDAAFRALGEMAEYDATGAVLGAWREVEGALGRLVPDGTFGQRRVTPGMRLKALSESYGGSADIMRRVRELREIRNQIVHSSEIELTQEGARTFVAKAKEVADSLALASAPRSQAMRLEDAIYEALNRGGFTVAQQQAGRSQYDFLVADDSRTDSFVAVEAKFVSDGLFHERNLREEAGKLASMPVDVTSLLVVTNGSLMPRVQEFNATIDGSSGIDGRRLEVVQWRGPDDDAALTRALMRAMRKSGPQ
ncbi:PIN domain-containing protein [Streptomyces sp. NPDC126503]|uniref:PIN-like domain-containing protein n=1 Tax=Streptomyces sp. NPDC126503 TaxID=3155315 RepID=UPI0033242365